MVKNIKNILIVVLIILLLVLKFLSGRNATKYEELESLNTSLSDSLKITVNKNGEYVSKISAYETLDTKVFLQFKTFDSLTIELQKDVKRVQKYLKNQGSVTNFESETTVETGNITEVTGTVEKPIYTSSVNLNGWITGMTVANEDSTFLNLQVKNKYSVVVGSEKQGFLGLGKAKPFVEITNLNPYSKTTTLKTYQVNSKKQKRFGFGPTLAIGINKDLKFNSFLGVGINYTIFRF